MKNKKNSGKFTAKFKNYAPETKTGLIGPEFPLIIWILNIFQSWYFFQNIWYTLVVILGIIKKILASQYNLNHCHVRFFCAECSINQYRENKFKMRASVNISVRTNFPIFGEPRNFTKKQLHTYCDVIKCYMLKLMY